MGGMGWDEIRITQVVYMTNLFLKHSKSGDEVGKLSIINIQTTHLISGLRKYILKTKYQVKYVDPCWVMVTHTLLFE